MKNIYKVILLIIFYLVLILCIIFWILEWRDKRFGKRVKWWCKVWYCGCKGKLDNCNEYYWKGSKNYGRGEFNLMIIKIMIWNEC